jgi:hypothetical protein
MKLRASLVLAAILSIGLASTEARADELADL